MRTDYLGLDWGPWLRTEELSLSFDWHWQCYWLQQKHARNKMQLSGWKTLKSNPRTKITQANLQEISICHERCLDRAARQHRQQEGRNSLQHKDSFSAQGINTLHSIFMICFFLFTESEIRVRLQSASPSGRCKCHSWYSGGIRYKVECVGALDMSTVSCESSLHDDR